ncbi:MAG: TonB-dependent receptor, partial [Lentisphaeria bacterium]|nr:TonB-dependent receptor [Candidatus Neomarinimicrobiota bacterium]MCF7842736.1 TonB-dependent receptor [Lentisphaeria bacterium]
NRETWILNYDEMVEATPKHQVSPRLGVAFPITSTAVIHMNYGWFFQMPLFDYLYTNSNYNQANGFSPLGDPDLRPAKTVMWEVSCRGEMTKTTMIDFTIFKKEATNLVDANTYKSLTTSDVYRSSGYTQFVNLAMVNIQGLEVYLKRNYNENISGKISYTYMIGTGTGSSSFEKFNWIQQGYRVPVNQYYLSWDQRHTLVVNLDMKKPGLGGMNILWRYNSPFPYTLDRAEATHPNNARMDATTTFDIRLHRSFDINKHISAYFFAETMNLLDAENILWMDTAGQPGGLLEDPGAIDYRRRARIGIGLNF